MSSEMPTSDSVPETMTQPMSAGYVLAIVVGTVISFGLYTVTPWIIAIALNTPIQWQDFFRTTVPAVEHAVMWNGKLVVPQLELNIFNPGMTGHRLVIIDPATKASKVITTRIPPGTIQLVPDETCLWCLSGAVVYRIQDDTVTQSSTGMTVAKDPAFLYEGKLAVIVEKISVDDSPNTFQLHTWTGTAWRHEGRVLLPTVAMDELEADSDGNAVVPDTTPAALKSFRGVVETRVFTANGKTHVFCSDGTDLVYCDHLEVIPEGTVSVLATENAPAPLSGWMSVGEVSDFQVGVDSQGVLVTEHDMDFNNGKMRNSTRLLRLVDGAWKELQQTDRAGFLIEPRLVSDGQRAFVVSQTLANKLSVLELGSDAKESKLAFDAGATMEKLSRTIQNVWWAALPVVVLYALFATWLMKKCRTDHYEYGHGTVRLASVIQRTVARFIDWMLIAGPIQILQWTMIGSQADLQEWWMDKISSIDVPTIAMVILAFVLYALLWLIAMGIMEGKWGVTPGKWVVGIRAVRTTLRPCGFFRAVLRELMVLIDGVLCFGWMPGAFCIALTACRQRMGDLVADTIVIRRGIVVSSTAE